MQIISQFVAWFPDSNNAGSEELAHTANLIRGAQWQLLRQAPYVLAVRSCATGAPAGPENRLLHVFPGTAASARLAAADFDAAQTLEGVHGKAETFAQCYNLLQAAAGGFVLESDALGLVPVYTARAHGGTVLASRIADILRLFPALAEPADSVALYEELGFWAPLAGRTLHRQIRRTLPGGRCRWAPRAGFSVERGRDLLPAAIKTNWFMDEAIEAVQAATAQSLREKTAGVPQPMLLALSGGFDSRFIAALCGDQPIRVRAVTYARRQHSEGRSSRGVARALGIDLRMLPHPVDGTLRYLPQYLDVMEGTADPAGAAMMSLRGAGATHGSALLHGFCADLQEGARITDFAAANFASRETVAAAILRHAFPATRPDLTTLFQPAVDLDEVRQDILSGLRRDCPPYQAYLLWYLENRNRRYVGATCAMLGQQFDVVMPFYDRRLFALWHSMPPIALAGRSVFKQLLARHYPALARIPHPEEPAPVTPNLRWQLARFYHLLPARMLEACVGPSRADEVRLRLHRHHNFRTFGKLEAPQQRAWMLTELARLRPTLRDGLGVDLAPGHAAVLARDSQALRTVFGIARYAECRRMDNAAPQSVSSAPALPVADAAPVG